MLVYEVVDGCFCVATTVALNLSSLVSNMLTLDGSKMFAVCICFCNSFELVKVIIGDACAQAVSLDLCPFWSATFCHWWVKDVCSVHLVL